MGYYREDELMLGYTFKVWADGSLVLVPDPPTPKGDSCKGRRTKATPRKRSDDLKKLAKVHGWSRHQLYRRTKKVIEAKGSDVYVPNTKKAREIRGCKSTEYVGISGRTDGDYIHETASVARTERDALRAKVREAVSSGLIAKSDAPRWAR